MVVYYSNSIQRFESRYIQHKLKSFLNYVLVLKYICWVGCDKAEILVTCLGESLNRPLCLGLDLCVWDSTFVFGTQPLCLGLDHFLQKITKNTLTGTRNFLVKRICNKFTSSYVNIPKIYWVKTIQDGSGCYRVLCLGAPIISLV
jgi:hypothetical protein